MPMPSGQKSEDRQGDLVVKAQGVNRIEGFYTPRKKMADAAGITVGTAEKMVEINLHKGTLTLYPLNTWPTHADFLKPKYGQIERISLPLPEDVCETLKKKKPTTADDLLDLLQNELLPGFTKDPDYGLGLAREYKDIIDAIEQHSNCVEIYIDADNETSINLSLGIFILNENDYDEARKKINSIASLGQKAAAEVKDGTIYNMFAEKLGTDPKTIRVGRSPIRRLITAAAQGKPPLVESDQDAVMSMLKTHSKEIAEAKPQALAKLQDEIELVTLEVLIKRYQEMLARPTVEAEWQRFFRENSFILTMAFGYPIVEILEQGSVGGGQLTGGGSKFSDFIARNSQTNNAAIFEIKTPKTPLLNKTAFRGKVFSATSTFSGSIAQVLDQKYHLGQSLPTLKSNDRGLILEAYAVHCCLIIGTTPEGLDEQKSFEIFRRNSREVEIITFDELLEKLKQLHAFLSSRVP